MKLALIATLILAGCSFQSPGEECLTSCRKDLKDPDSGKVVSFDAPTLRYSATNTYGGRLTKETTCVKTGKGWREEYHPDTYRYPLAKP